MKEGGKEFKKSSFGSWEIEGKSLEKSQLLGSGQFGEVFQGTYRGEQVAIKTLKGDTSSDSIDEFLAEAQVMTEMKHPNIVQFIGVGTCILFS